MRFLSKIAAPAMLLVVAAPMTYAQRVDVQNIDRRAFAIHVNAENGSTPERAGQLAMARACAESRERGFTHMGVVQYKTELASTDAQTRSSGTDYHVTGQGQVYNTPRSAQSRTVTWGNAVLQVTLMSERAAVGSGPGRLADAIQVIDARTCSVVQ